MKVGTKVEHILSGDWLLVLEIDKEKYLCRTKSHEKIWFYSFELRELK